MRDFPQFLKVEIVKMTPGLSVPLQGRSENDPGTAETVRGRPPDKLPHPSSGTRFVLQTKMQPTNPNAHTYVNGDDPETHGNAVTQNPFLKQFI